MPDHLRRLCRALEIEPVLMDAPLANFVRTVRPVVARISEDELPMALAAVMSVLGRAAAGQDLLGGLRSVTVVSGDGADIDNNNA